MSHELESLQLPDGVMFDAQARALRGVLSNITGLTLNNAHQGTFHISGSVAEVTIDTNALQIRLPMEQAQSLGKKLQASHPLPTTVRYAVIDKQLYVHGEAPLDPATLAESLLHIATGLRIALGKRPRSNATESLTPEHIDGAVRQLDISPEAVVRSDGTWEIHQRLSDEATPVTLLLDGGDLIVARKVLEVAADHEAFASLAHCALHINARLQHCRLAWCDGHIVAEARIPSVLLHAAVLAQHLRAVAVAARHAQPTLEILLKFAAIEREFRRVFTDV